MPQRYASTPAAKLRFCHKAAVQKAQTPQITNYPLYLWIKLITFGKKRILLYYKPKIFSRNMENMTAEEFAKALSRKDVRERYIQGLLDAYRQPEEEIREAFPPEEAEEYLALRRATIEEWMKSRKAGNDNAGTTGDDIPLAAEDPAEYR